MAGGAQGVQAGLGDLLGDEYSVHPFILAVGHRPATDFSQKAL